MRLPRLFRTTPFRLTLLFLALFAAAASAFLAYIYLATAGEATRRTDQNITREMRSLVAAYDRAGVDAVNQSLIERAASERPFLYLLMKPDGTRISGSIAESPLEDVRGAPSRASFSVTDYDAQGRLVKHPARGFQERLSGGEILFVGADVSEDQAYVVKIVNALRGAGTLVVVLGLMGGVLVSRNVSRSMAGLTDVVTAVRNGDLGARAPVRGTRDEFDELAEGLNEMLDRLERSMAGHRHAGDAIEDQAYVVKIVRALWGAGALVIVLGLAGGLLVSRNVSRSMGALNDVVAAVRNGEFGARATVRGPTE